MFYSSLFEITTQTIPLFLVQVYNNDSMNKFEYPLDNLNYIFTILSCIVYFLDVMIF